MRFCHTSRRKFFNISYRYTKCRIPSTEADLPCDTFTGPFRISADFLVRFAALRASPSTRCFAAHLEGRLCGARKRAVPSLPSIYEPACAQNRAHADSTLRFAQGQAMLGYFRAAPVGGGFS